MFRGNRPVNVTRALYSVIMVQVHVLSGDLVQHLSKARFRHRFDRVHIGLASVDIASSDINDALADRAVVTMDTGR